MTEQPPVSARQRFLFVSIDGFGADLAWQVSKEGHEVRLHIVTPSQRDVAEGLVPHVDDWHVSVDWADVIIFDDVLGQGDEASILRRKGKAVIGGTPFTDRLEDDRAFGQDILKRSGVPTLLSASFSSFEEAIAFVRKHPRRFVLKPDGEAANRKELLFIGDDPAGEDVIAVLSSYSSVYKDIMPSFQLQERAFGIEAAVGAFFNGKEFVTPINVNFEHKRLFPGEKGPMTGEMGTLMFWSEPNRFFRQTLEKVAPFLTKEGYVGYIDLNCIVNEESIHPLEFTCRFGYPTISIQQEGLLLPVGEFLAGLARGTLQSFPVKKGYQLGLRLVVPPFPYDDERLFLQHVRDKPFRFAPPLSFPDYLPGIHIEDARLAQGKLVITGTTGLGLIVCGSGLTVEEARKEAYGRAALISFPDLYYRDDIGGRWPQERDTLLRLGLIQGASKDDIPSKKKVNP